LLLEQLESFGALRSANFRVVDDSGVQRTVLRQFEKTDDVVVRVSHARLGDLEWLDVRDFVLSTQTYHRGVTMPLHEVQTHRPARGAKPVGMTFNRPVNCGRCGRLLGYIERQQTVRAHCADPECLATQPGTASEDRDSVIEFMSMIGIPSSEIGDRFGISRQAVDRLTK
jgi:hypothetical protein